MTEDEMVGWHPNSIDMSPFEQTLGDSGGQKGLVCGSPWGFQNVKHNLGPEQKQ